MHGMFEVKQPMHQTHEALCPVCGNPTQRVYTPVPHYYPDTYWDADLPHVPTGTRWTHGWSAKEEGEAAGN